jgi:hypothetical protein
VSLGREHLEHVILEREAGVVEAADDLHDA